MMYHSQWPPNHRCLPSKDSEMDWPKVHDHMEHDIYGNNANMINKCLGDNFLTLTLTSIRRINLHSAQS